MAQGKFTRVPPSTPRTPIPTRPLSTRPIVTRPAPPPAPAQAQPPAPPPAAPPSLPAIRVEGLRRLYGSKVALEGASFEVQQGEVFGFLGPNGAGKTTTIRILCGLLRPSGGQAFLLGHAAGPDGVEAKARIGYVPDEPSFPARLKALPLLVAYGRFYGLERGACERRARELLGQVGLAGQEQGRIRAFSHGMKKRYALAQALLHDPPVLIMDEPSSGLDPAGTAWFRDIIRSLRGQGKTVFLSSHLLHEVQQLCDRVGIINQGKVLAVDTIEGLARRLRQRVEIVATAEGLEEGAVRAVEALVGVRAVRRDGDRLVIDADTDAVSPEVNAVLVRHGAKVRSLESASLSLEDIYLAITGTAGTVGA